MHHEPLPSPYCGSRGSVQKSDNSPDFQDCHRSRMFLMLTVVMGTLVTGCRPNQEFDDTSPDSDVTDVTLSLTWEIGGSGSAGGVEFVAPQSFLFGAISPSGMTLIADRQGPTVFLVSPSGEVLHSWSSRGSGPGDLQQPIAVDFLGDSTIWVTDRALNRITHFAVTGNVLRTARHSWEQVPGGPWSVRAERVLANGGLLGRLGEAILDPGGGRLSNPVVIWDPDGRLFVAGSVPDPMPLTPRVETPSGVPVYPPQPFQASPVIGSSPGGTWVYAVDRAPAAGPVGEIRIRRFTPSGAQLGEVSIHYRATAMPDSVYAGVRSMAAQYAAAANSALGLEAEAAFDAMWVPAWLPPVRVVIADESGFWLQRESLTWERYDLEGRATDRMAVPPDASRLLAIRGDQFLTWRQDSLGVVVARMYHRVRREP